MSVARIWAWSHPAASHLLASSRAAATQMCVGCPGRVGKGVSPACVLPSPCPPVSQRADSASVCQCCIGTEDMLCFGPWEGKGLLGVPGVAQRWSGRKQNLLENACKPCVCYLVPAPWGSGHGHSCVTPLSSSPGVFGVPRLHCSFWLLLPLVCAVP